MGLKKSMIQSGKWRIEIMKNKKQPPLKELVGLIGVIKTLVITSKKIEILTRSQLLRSINKARNLIFEAIRNKEKKISSI